MKNFLKNQIAIAIIIGAFILALGIIGYAFINKSNSNSNESLNDIVNADKLFTGQDFKDNEYILGNRDNKITIVVYSDFECPYCKILQEGAIQKLQKEYSLNDKDLSQAKIGIVYKNYGVHQKSQTEINAALCTREIYGQNSYINFVDRIFEISPTNNGLELSLLPEISKYAVEKSESKKEDFDISKFQKCLNEQTFNEEYANTMFEGQQLGIDGTPFIYILFKDGNKNMIINKISGAKDVSYFETIINKLLKIK